MRIPYPPLSATGALLLLATLVAASPSALACGYEDPHSVQMGALNFAYPNALHVGTAVWQAQMEGALPRPAPASPARAVFKSRLPALVRTVQADHAHEASHADDAALAEALRVVAQTRDRLAAADDMASRPPVALVFASKMLWSRLVPGGQQLEAQPHVGGPERDDVVLVTEALVLRALLARSMAVDEAFDRGLIRLYGDEPGMQAVRQWLAALAGNGFRGS